MYAMSERIRLTYDVREEYRRAINLFAAHKGLTVSDAIELMCIEFLPKYLEMAKEEVASGTPIKSRRGRPKKDKSD